MSLEDLAFPSTVREHLAALDGAKGYRNRPAPDGRMVPILAIDPGTEQSGWCAFDGEHVNASGVMENPELLTCLQRPQFSLNGYRLAIEMVASYGMPVGREVFETVRWIGRFQQAWHAPDEVTLVYRKDIKLQLCGTTKAKDANIRQALLDMFPRTGGGKTPQIGIKAKPGPLYGVSSHAWAALAVAVVAKGTL